MFGYGIFILGGCIELIFLNIGGVGILGDCWNGELSVFNGE